MKNQTEKSSISKAVARQALEEERKERVERCRTRIEQILSEEKCVLNPIVIVQKGSVDARIDILALD